MPQPKQTRLSTKGQLIIPKEVRDRYGWHAGSVLLIEDRGTEVVLKPSVDIPATSLDDLIGCTEYSGPRRSLDEMDAAIARGARNRS